MEPPPPYSFKVPYNDNEYSEPSREGSIQILESHPRTFSVPSTDGESEFDESDAASLEIASSVQGETTDDSAITTPDYEQRATETARLKSVDHDKDSGSGSSQPKTRVLSLKGPSLVNVLAKPASAGNTEQTPIDLEADGGGQHDAHEFVSDDEGPEILPISQKPCNTSEVLIAKYSEANHQESHVPNLPAEESNLDTEDELKGVTSETQARISGEKDKDVLSDQLITSMKSFAEATDGFDSADDDGFDQDDGFFDSGDNEVMPSLLCKDPQPTQGKQAVKSLPSLPGCTADSQNSHKPNQFNHSMDDGTNVSHPVWPPPAIQREPSPSDAALARHSSDGQQTFNCFDSNRVIGSNTFGTPYGNDHTIDRYPLVNVPFGYQYVHKPYGSGVTEYDTHSMPYNQGPFVRKGKAGGEQGNDAWPSLFGDDFFEKAASDCPRQHYPTATEEGPSFHPDIDENARYATKPQAEEAANAFASKTSIISYPSNSCLKSRKINDGQCSKINISNLVNSSQSDTPRTLKRKAEELNTVKGLDETHHGSVVRATTASLPSLPQQSQSSNHTHSGVDTQLPDAQAQDPVQAVETVPFTQDSLLNPVIKPTSDGIITMEAKPTEEPARKKARTSTSSSKGVGKFISGVCVGLVGAFAAFVATIPASVREEALRELSNAA